MMFLAHSNFIERGTYSRLNNLTATNINIYRIRFHIPLFSLTSMEVLATLLTVCARASVCACLYVCSVRMLLQIY